MKRKEIFEELSQLVKDYKLTEKGIFTLNVEYVSRRLKELAEELEQENEKVFSVYGYEQDWIKDCKTLKEAKKFVKECKRFDKENDFEDIYYIVEEMI